MAYEVLLPKLGQTVEESRIVEWLKAEGDPVERGDVLFTVETDKAVLDVEAPRKGFLRKILMPAGEMVPVLTVVGLITRTADEPIETEAVGSAASETATSEAPKVAPSAPTVAEPSTTTAPGRVFSSPRARKAAADRGIDVTSVKGTGPGGRVIERDVLGYVAAVPKATPVARHVAEELGVNLAGISGTGPRGRVTKEDVQAAAAGAVTTQTAPETPVSPVAVATAPATPTSVEPVTSLTEVPLTGIRAIIAQRMHESHSVTAPVTEMMEVDATAFVALRERLKVSLAKELGFNLGYNDLLIKVAAKALRQFPNVNARLDGNVIRHLDAVHIGLAVDTDRGLLVPHVSDADKKGLIEIARDVRAMAERARTGRSLPDELVGGTFTITNLGMYDVDGFTPIINHPEAAILGVGRIKPKPVVVEGEIVVRQMVWLSLTFDHRLVDGAPAARFLQAIKQMVEEPYLLLA